MSCRLFSIVGLALLLLGVTTAVPPPETPMMRMVPSPLVKSEVDRFIQCLHNTGKAYDVGVDGGSIIVSPTESRAIDLKGQDKALADCMHQVSEALRVAVESSNDGPANSGNNVPLSDVDFEWLLNRGASGRKQVPSPLSPSGRPVDNQTSSPGANAHTLDTAAPAVAAYYNFFFDLDSGCKALDLVHSVTEKCYTRGNSWKSSRVQNIDPAETLAAGIWPHHDCAQGNQRALFVNPKTETERQDRTTYSYNGNF